MSSESNDLPEVGIDGDMDAPNYAVKRWNICIACDRLFTPTKTCKECGCFMKIKVRLKGSSCPLSKWSAL